jgi:hypothetical protein
MATMSATDKLRVRWALLTAQSAAVRKARNQELTWIDPQLSVASFDEILYRYSITQPHNMDEINEIAKDVVAIAVAGMLTS